MPAVASVALWSQYSSFFVAIKLLLNLHGEPRLFQGYDVTEVHWEATHLRGAV